MKDQSTALAQQMNLMGTLIDRAARTLAAFIEHHLQQSPTYDQNSSNSKTAAKAKETEPGNTPSKVDVGAAMDNVFRQRLGITLWAFLMGDVRSAAAAMGKSPENTIIKAAAKLMKRWLQASKMVLAAASRTDDPSGASVMAAIRQVLLQHVKVQDPSIRADAPNISVDQQQSSNIAEAESAVIAVQLKSTARIESRDLSPDHFPNPKLGHPTADVLQKDAKERLRQAVEDLVQKRDKDKRALEKLETVAWLKEAALAGEATESVNPAIQRMQEGPEARDSVLEAATRTHGSSFEEKNMEADRRFKSGEEDIYGLDDVQNKPEKQEKALGVTDAAAHTEASSREMAASLEVLQHPGPEASRSVLYAAAQTDGSKDADQTMSGEEEESSVKSNDSGSTESAGAAAWQEIPKAMQDDLLRAIEEWKDGQQSTSSALAAGSMNVSEGQEAVASLNAAFLLAIEEFHRQWQENTTAGRADSMGAADELEAPGQAGGPKTKTHFVAMSAPMTTFTEVVQTWQER